MRILCAHSGIEFNCEHFPGNLYSRETSHPIFTIPQKRLLSYLGKWSSSGLTQTDSYLLFLALLNSTDRVDFRSSAVMGTKTPSIVASNMEFLYRTVLKINTVSNPTIVFPKFIISPETRNLENITHWIQAWHDAFEEFKSGKIKDWDDRKLAQKEHALERLIRSPHKPISSYAGSIAEWASIAGEFPTFMTTNPFSGMAPISCSDYWKIIIEKCTKEDGTVFTVPRIDIEDILEHCETKIHYGTLFSTTLFSVLRKAIDRQKRFLGSFADIPTEPYKILESGETTSGIDEVEKDHIRRIIENAPSKRPEKKDYPKLFDFMKAEMAWNMAQRYSAPKSSNNPGESHGL